MDSSNMCTIIRVKRQLNDSNTDRHSFKRLRHIGSFADKHDENTLSSSAVFRQTGINKRIKFSDLNTEQFYAYVQKYDNIDQVNNNADEVSQCSTDAPIDGKVIMIELQFFLSDLFFFVDQQIMCNGEIMQCVDVDTQVDKYIYDYYVLMDDLIDFQETDKDEHLNDDDEPSSNDENYRYNDYPDDDYADDDSTNSNNSETYDSLELSNSYSDESFRNDFEKLKLKLSDDDCSDDD